MNIYNTTSNTLIAGTVYDDSIKNADSYSDVSNVTIQASNGNDSVYSRGFNIVIDGGTDDDNIWNDKSSYVTISAGTGDDYIDNYYSSSVTVNAGTGNDSIYNEGCSNISISGDSGNDYIKNSDGTSVKIIAGEGNDTVKNYCYWGNSSMYCTISGGTGNDEIYNGVSYSKKTTDYTSISGGTGNDSITNYGNFCTIMSGSGQDYITNWNGSNCVIFGNTGNDTLRNWTCTDCTISGDDGNDSIESYGKSCLIKGDKGNDKIFNDGQYCTINGGSGDDLVSLSSSAKNVIINFSNSEGRDTIYGLNSDDKIKITSGNINNAKLNGDDVIIKVGSSSITLKNGKDKEFTVIDSKGKEIKFTNTYKGVETSTLPSGVSYNKAKTALTVKSPFSGEINLVNYDSKIVTVDASRDTKFVTIKGNAKNNVIKAGTGGSSLYGQGGDDSLYGGSGVDTFYYGDGQGNDVIVNYTVGKDKIKLTSGSIKSSSLSGTDVILNIGNGSIKVKNAVGKEITVIDSKGKSTTKVYGSTTRPNQKSQQQVIKDFMAVLDTTTSKGKAAIDSAFKLASGSRYKSMQNVIDNFLSDLGKTDFYTFLLNCCGMDIANEDTGAITGLDTGGSTSAKTNISIIPEDGDPVDLVEKFNSNTLNDLPDVDYNSQTGTLKFTKRGLTLTFKNYNKIVTASTKNNKSAKIAISKLNIINGLYTWWIEESLNLISESYGKNFGFTKDSNATTKEMEVDLDHNFGEETTVAQVVPNYKEMLGKKTATRLTLQINMKYYSSVDLSVDKNGRANDDDDSHTLRCLDNCIAHEMTHGIMAANMNYFHWLPTIITEGLGELTRGIETLRLDNILHLVENPKDLEKVFNNAYSEQYMNGDFKNYQYATGYMLLRYFARQVSINSGLPTGLSYSGDQKTLNVQSSYKGTIDLKDYASYSPNSTRNNTLNIDASHDKNALTIIGNDEANIIKAGTGGSSLYGHGDNDTLFGGSGKDTFFYADGDGNDEIVNYTAGKDKIKLTSGSIKSSKVNRTDVILNIGNGSIKIKNGAGKKITVIDSNDNETTQVYGVSRKVSSLWFADDTNFATSSAQIDSITKSGLSDYSLGNVDATTDWTALTPTDSLTSALTFSDK